MSNIIKILIKILITLLIVLKNQKEPLTTTQILFPLEKYPKSLEVIARAIHIHGRQVLALRGHRETLQESVLKITTWEAFSLI